MEMNYLAILVAALAAMVLGALWYGKPLFGSIWMKLVGMTEKDGEAAKKSMGKYRLVGFISQLVMAYVLSWFITAAGLVMVDSSALMVGLSTAFWLWLGFVATVTLGRVLWEKSSCKLYVLNNAYTLISLLIMAAILSSWK